MELVSLLQGILVSHFFAFDDYCESPNHESPRMTIYANDVPNYDENCEWRRVSCILRRLMRMMNLFRRSHLFPHLLRQFWRMTVRAHRLPDLPDTFDSRITRILTFGVKGDRKGVNTEGREGSREMGDGCEGWVGCNQKCNNIYCSLGSACNFYKWS